MISGLFMTTSFQACVRTFFVAALVVVGAGSAARGDNARTTANPAPPPFHQPSYFFTLDLDPRYQFVGTGALTPEEAAHANCYRFIYNTDGRLEQIEFRRAGIPRPDPLLGVERIDFEFQTGVERRWYRTAQGDPASDLDGVYGEELALNRAGFPTDVTNLDASGGRARDGAGVIHYVRTLDAQNRLVVGRRIGFFGTPITDENGYFETRTSYDEQGRAIERDNYDAAGKLLNDNEGVAQVRTTYTIDPDSTQITESYFDASGLAVEEKSSGVHQRQRMIDRRGFLVDEAYFDTTGAPTETNDGEIHERRLDYDDRGNELSEEYFDSDGKPKDQKALDYARIVYQYDDKNRVIEKDYFGDDGTPQILLNLGAAVIRQEYDQAGNLVRRQFFDGQGHPSPHVLYGAPAIRIKVEGDTTIITLRNGKDQPMKNPVHGYYAFSFKTNVDEALSVHNDYFDRYGHRMSALRVFIINPHLHALKTTPVMQWSARLGVGAAGLGALLGCFLALRKAAYTQRRKVYVPRPWERLLGWISVLFILEGSLRFFMTIYWAWVDYQNGRMGHGFYLLEAIFIVFLLYRLLRFSVTMRVLNVGKDDIHSLVRDFFAKANLKPEWVESRGIYVTPTFGVRIRFFAQKNHAYLSFRRQQYYSPILAIVSLILLLWMSWFGVFQIAYVVPVAVLLAWLYVRFTRPNLAGYREGRELARGLSHYIRAHVGEVQAPARTRLLTLYYPCLALFYLLLAGTAFYTLAQLLRGF